MPDYEYQAYGKGYIRRTKPSPCIMCGHSQGAGDWEPVPLDDESVAAGALYEKQAADRAKLAELRSTPFARIVRAKDEQ